VKKDVVLRGPGRLSWRPLAFWVQFVHWTGTPRGTVVVAGTLNRDALTMWADAAIAEVARG